jgi:hypothetical protein
MLIPQQTHITPQSKSGRRLALMRNDTLAAKECEYLTVELCPILLFADSYRMFRAVSGLTVALFW